MGEMIFRPLIEDMTWSYSRIKTFNDCPYRFFLKYIHEPKVPEIDQFYSSYGSFMHKIIERYYKHELSKEDMTMVFLSGFHENVKGMRPPVGVVEKYIRCGVDYLNSFSPFRFNMIDVERVVYFEINGIKMTGVLDYIGELDGEYYIVDNKSRNLSKRSSRAKPTAKDRELDDMLRQLYLYSAYVRQEYGKFPKALCFNCFRSNTFIEEPFNMDAYEATIRWVEEKIEEIKDTEDFEPNIEFFPCLYICGVHNDCVYADSLRDRRK